MCTYVVLTFVCEKCLLVNKVMCMQLDISHRIYSMHTHMHTYIHTYSPGSRALPYRFRLSIGPWSECNRTCGTGCQNRTVECIRFVAESGSLTNPETVNISFCELDGKIIPRTVRMCNMFPCPFWWTGAFGEVCKS